jgi:hypothetical protein
VSHFRLRHITPIEPTQLAWAAGFFDGEGHIRCQSFTNVRNGNDRTAIAIEISQALYDGEDHSETLLRFQRSVGGLGSIYVRRDYFKRRLTSPSWRIQERWQATGFQNCQAIIAMLWPFLGTVKRKQARTALLSRLEYERIPRHPKSRIELCKRGHNEWIFRSDGSGFRRCRACNREDARKHRLAKTA